jgi:predicted small secreted protein
MLRKTLISISALVLIICIFAGCNTMEGTKEGLSEDLQTAKDKAVEVSDQAQQVAGHAEDQAKEAASHAKQAADHAADTLP